MAEGVDPKNILVTGNTVIDALMVARKLLVDDEATAHGLVEEFDYLNPDSRLILVTGHRRESFGEGFERVCAALCQIAADNTDVQIVYPVHLNPNILEPAQRLLAGYSNIILISPLPYLSFCYLMNKAYIIVTDSGGIQEEAPALGKPVLVNRYKTERPEAVEAGRFVWLVRMKVE